MCSSSNVVWWGLGNIDPTTRERLWMPQACVRCKVNENHWQKWVVRTEREAPNYMWTSQAVYQGRPWNWGWRGGPKTFAASGRKRWDGGLAPYLSSWSAAVWEAATQRDEAKKTQSWHGGSTTTMYTAHHGPLSDQCVCAEGTGKSRLTYRLTWTVEPERISAMIWRTTSRTTEVSPPMGQRSIWVA